MRLKNSSDTPIGGWRFEIEINGKTKVIKENEGGKRKLLSKIRSFYANNRIDVPENLEDIVEDQICMRQPVGRCFYTKGIGDQFSKVIHGVAKVIDTGARRIGVSSNLEKKARGCSGCGRRRNKLNQL